MDTNYIIETKNLTKQYGSQKSVADLNIHVKRGRIYGLLGRNGAGKTTTMKMLLGLTKPTSGEVKIWGKSLQGNEKKLLPRIGSLIESPGFYPNLTGTEMRSVDIGAVAAESLPDVSGMTFDNALSRKERISRFLQTVKNPYCFCIGGVGVKIEFAESGPSLQDKLTDFLLRQRSGL